MAEFEAAGDRRGQAVALQNMGSAYALLGEYPQALSHYERAHEQLSGLGDRAGAATTVQLIGNVYASLGNHERALSTYERALALQEEIGDEAGIATTLGSLGNAYSRLHDYPRALAMTEQALVKFRAVGNKAFEALTLANLGTLRFKLGDHRQALAVLEEALVAQRALKDKHGEALSFLNMGLAHLGLGDRAKARELLDRGVGAATSLRAAPLMVFGLTSLTRLHLAEDDFARALGTARDALGAMETLLGGLGQEQGAMAREQYADLFAMGTVAAAHEKDLGAALTFLESGRAGALLDALDKREALRWKAESLSPELRQLDGEARAKESEARHAYDLAVKNGASLAEKKAASKALDEAMDGVREVAGRIQRELKQQANFFYPRAKTLFDIQDALDAGQVLVLYGLCEGAALALIVDPDAARFVPLGAVDGVVEACAALDCAEPATDPKAALDTLRALLVEPLKLGPKVKQVLVSPEGPLCFLPFGALFEQAVAMTPSGTTHVLLRDDEGAPGKGILALGDPDYGGVSKAAEAIYHRGHVLSALPATKVEAETIGTKALIGAEASEAGLRQVLSTTRRWRAVHLACHGLVDIDNPMLSSLALSRSGEDDGFLTALEILRTRIPADLAVLSACETAKGKIVRGEGIVGLTRAFMFAGSPRVICSLWKVDDEATRALMIRFYELWNPSEGKGLGAAEALAKAQAHIRAQEKWKHPYYWAAWVLWGLPN